MLPNDIRLECFDRAAQFFRYLTERDLPSKGRRLPKKASARKTPDIKRVTSGADVFDFHTVNGFNSVHSGRSNHGLENPYSISALLKFMAQKSNVVLRSADGIIVKKCRYKRNSHFLLPLLINNWDITARLADGEWDRPSLYESDGFALTGLVGS